MSYAPLKPMIKDAASTSQIWRLVAGSLTIVAVLAGWVAATSMGLRLLLNTSDQIYHVGFDLTPLGTAANLFLISGLGVGTWIAARLWHGRRLGSLVGYAARTLRHFVLAAAATWATIAVTWLVYQFFADPVLQPNLDVATWARWLPLALILILFQTGSEELLFRGYLQSQLAARFKSPLVWLMLPALLFGAAHYLPVDGKIAPGLVYVFVTAVFGLISGDLTARTGSIGAAWGLHFANNCVAILVLVYAGALSGLGLYTTGTIEEALSLSPLMILDLISVLLIYLVIRRIVTA